MARRCGPVRGAVEEAIDSAKTPAPFSPRMSDDNRRSVAFSASGSTSEKQKQLNDALLLLGAAIDIFEKQEEAKRASIGSRSPVTTASFVAAANKRDLVSSSVTADQKPVKVRVRNQSTGPRATNLERTTMQGCQKAVPRRIGPLTAEERRARVDRWLKKRARMIARQRENSSKKRKNIGRYVGRTKFAMSRRRVKGRFVSLKFLNERGIKFDSGAKPQSGWVCSTLGGRVFVELEDALKAVDGHHDGVKKMKEEKKEKQAEDASRKNDNVSSESAVRVDSAQDGFAPAKK